MYTFQEQKRQGYDDRRHVDHGVSGGAPVLVEAVLQVVQFPGPLQLNVLEKNRSVSMAAVLLGMCMQEVQHITVQRTENVEEY